jgi:FkbM family methyltransferase
MHPIEFLKRVRKTFLTNYRRTYYSQFGEDTILRELLRKRRDGFYVDVGCYHPKKFSNTYMLRSLGWRGVNIDMEEEKIQLFRLARPQDFNVVAAVSDVRQQVTIHRDRLHSLGSTIVPGLLAKEDAGLETLSLQTRTLDDILAESPLAGKPIDVLSIDCEGHDFQVLKSLSLATYQPKVIIVESHARDIEAIVAGPMYQYLVGQRYALRSWMHLSLVFVLQGSYADR